VHRSSRLSSDLLTTSSQSAISNERVDKPPRERARGGKARRLAVALVAGLLGTSLFGCPELTGTNGAVRDNLTDKVLYSQSLGGLEAPPYSTVKVMTLHLALRAIKQGKFDENTFFAISQHAVDQDCTCFPGGNMRVLAPGDKMPVLMALYSIGQSHGETTMAMAELVANVNRPTPVVGTGTSKAQSKLLEQEFIAMMNAEVINLQLNNTHYTSVHGAPSDTQVTSVLDLAKLWDAAVAENSSFLTYTGTRKFPTLTWSPLSASPYWANMSFPDRVYNYYPGIDSDKNGCCGSTPSWNDTALVTQATRAGRSLTASVLLKKDQPAAEQDNAELLRWGFEQVFTPISWADGSHASSVAAAHGMDCWAWSDVVTVSRTSTNALELIRWSTNPDSAAISKTATLTQPGASMGGVDVAWVNWDRIVAVYESPSRAGPPTVRASLYGTDDGIYPIATVDLGPGAAPEIEA
jgi:D-alanyl-D-alanine carboxypeptidase